MKTMADGLMHIVRRCIVVVKLAIYLSLFLVLGPMLGCVEYSKAKTALVGQELLPVDLVGVWASRDTEFQGHELRKGGALYLTRHATGADLGIGPPPLGIKMPLSYDEGESMLYAMELESSPLKWRRFAKVDHAEGRLIGVASPEVILFRRSSQVPPEMREKLSVELWKSEGVARRLK